MKKLLLVATVLLATFITLTITQDYTFNELLLLTITIGNSINALLLFTWLIICDLKRLEWKEESIHRLNVLRSQTEDNEEYIETINDLKYTVSKQVKTIDNYDSMWEQLKATINLGDKVKNIKTKRNGTVYAMRIIEWTEMSQGSKYTTIEYQLRKGGTFFKRNEIRKVEV